MKRLLNINLIAFEKQSCVILLEISMTKTNVAMTSYNYDIRIEDVLIAQAIGKLTKRKQDIILLSFFLSMTNADIATLMELAESAPCIITKQMH